MHRDLYIIGLMSGTSLDGLDIAYCHFSPSAEGVCYEILAADTVPYPDEWSERLSTLESKDAFSYALADVELGHYFGRCVCDFLSRHPGRVDYIASHGHTIFHQPHLGLTTQIGDIDAVAAETRIPVIGRFRNLDVALGGQGAPLVPIGDQILFSQYGSCLNLGGFSNISFVSSGQRLAFDVSPCNMALNYLSSELGLPYDRDGLVAQSGTVNSQLLDALQALDYYSLPIPKSLGKEWFVANVAPLVSNTSISVPDRLRTFVEHVALQVSSCCTRYGICSMVVTGGGAHNQFLLSRIRALSPQVEVIVPDPLVVDYKEALIFALLGYLRVIGSVNTLQSVTGAKIDSVGGSISGLCR